MKTKKKTQHPALKGGTRLTRDQAAKMVEGWTWEGFCTDDDQIGDFLALLYSIAAEPDATKRESYVIDIEAKLLAMSPAVSEAMNAVVTRRVRERLENGGGQ
jgi:hypothetical protein